MIGAFVIAFVIMLFLIGLPLFFLEITIAQYSKFGPLDVWKVVPMFRGIGACSLLIAAFISIYYNVLICYSLIYAISSFIPKLPWTACDFSWNDEKCCIPSKQIYNYTIEADNSTKPYYVSSCPKDSETPAKQYFKYIPLNLMLFCLL
jgi:hypothetical protein